MREESSLKSFLRFGVYCYNMLRGYYWQFMAKHFPAVNAKEEMKRQKQTELIREADIRNPIYFNEKMLWLKYHLYNKSDIVAMCYNKYMVREYVENKGLAHILNKLYFVSERIEDIPWSGLPEECVIKLSNGYYGHVFKRKDAPFDIEKAKKILRNTKRRCSFAFRISGDLFVYGTKPVYVCEKLIKAKSLEPYLMIIKFIVSMGYLVSWSIFMIVTMRIKVIFLRVHLLISRTWLTALIWKAKHHLLIRLSCQVVSMRCWNVLKNFLPTSLMFVLIL